MDRNIKIIEKELEGVELNEDDTRLIKWISDWDLWTVNQFVEIIKKCRKTEDTGLAPEEVMDGKMLTVWIPVEERLPLENEYRAICSAHSSKPFLRRLEIAYITDTTEYQFGYYDGYKWIDKRNKKIPNVVAWKIHEPFNPQN